MPATMPIGLRLAAKVTLLDRLSVVSKGGGLRVSHVAKGQGEMRVSRGRLGRESEATIGVVDGLREDRRRVRPSSRLPNSREKMGL